MKMMEKMIKVFLVGMLSASLVSCSQPAEGEDAVQTAQPAASADAAESETPAEPSESAEAPSDGEMINIGIVQPVEHMALDEARRGFIDALADKGFDETKVTFDMQNGQGDTSNLSTICDRFVSQEMDLVLAIATDSALTMAAKSTEIPIIATAVTSFESVGLVDSDEAPGGNVTGSSDMNPVAEQVKFIKTLIPDVNTIGLIYNSSEDNSVLQVEIAKEVIEAEGLEWTEVTVVSSNDVQQAMQSIAQDCDAVYIPTDNTMASAIATVHSVAMETKTPVIAGEENVVLQGALGTVGISYYDLGRQAGDMAAEVLNGADPAQMPVQYAASSDNIVINGTVASEIGFEVPEEFAEFVVIPENE